MTRCGTCVPPGPSRKVARWPLTFRDKEGNCERTHSRSSGEEAFSAKADLLCCSVIELSGYEILPTSQQPTTKSWFFIPSCWCVLAESYRSPAVHRVCGKDTCRPRDISSPSCRCAG